MMSIFDLLASREAKLNAFLGKEAGFGLLGMAAGGAALMGKKMIMNPMKTLTGVGSVLDVAGGAKKSRAVADNIARSVAAAPRMVGPTF